MRLFRASCLTFYAIVLFAAGVASARTWYVKPDGTGDVPTIQAAIDSARAGDLVLVAPGTYTYTGQGTGDAYALIRFLRGKAEFTVRSESGPELTIIDGEWKGRIIYIQGGENDQPTIEGFTITHGKGQALGDFYGGGLIAHLSSPIIRNCIFQNNTADRGGAVYYAGVSGPRFEDCTFIGNQAGYGAAIYLINSSLVPVFSRCVIRDNTATAKGGGMFVYHFPVTLDHCALFNNVAGQEGGAIYCERAYPSTISSCTIAGNRSAEGSAICLYFCQSVTVRNSIIAFNLDGPPFSIDQGETHVIGCSDIYGNAVSDGIPVGAVDGGYTFSIDPLFCGVAGSGNYYLRSDSPCKLRTEDDVVVCDLVGAYPVLCGTVSVKERSWGGIKNLFGR